ncbi:MAG: hypothetical protein RLZZ136_973 [Pseudomonadota bacterium]|jgi:hypothetical protein
MPRQFSVTLSGQDQAAANSLLLRRLWLRRWGWIVPIMGALLGLLLMLAARHFHPDLPPRKAVSLFIKGLLFALAFAGLHLFILLRVILRAGSAEGQATLYTLDPEGLIVARSSHTIQLRWSAFRYVIEDQNWLLLCRGALTFCAFPKSQLDAATLIALKHILAPS